MNMTSPAIPLMIDGEQLQWTYNYSPWTIAGEAEIPAFEIFDQFGKVADTNESRPAIEQEGHAKLIAIAPRAMSALINLAELVETNLVTGEVSADAWADELNSAIKVIRDAGY